MRSILLLAANDVRLTVKDKAAVFWLLLLPVFLTWIFARITGGGGPTQVALTVIDRDSGWLAQAFALELASPNVALTVLRGSDAGGPKAKEAVRWIELPAGFTDEAIAGHQQKLAIKTSDDASADGTRAAEVAVMRAIVRTLARAAEMEETKTPASLPAYEALRARPPLVTLATSTAGHGTAVRGVEQSVPGNLTFTVMMMTLIYGAVFLTIEKREGMLKRQLTLPISRTTMFAGKVVGRLLVALVQIAVLIVAGKLIFHLDYGSSPLGLATLLLAYAFAVASIATFLGAVLASPEQASTIGWLASAVMGALGGCWWPAEIMPDWLRTISHVFPTAWAMDGFHALISFGRGFGAVVAPVTALAAFGVAFCWLAARKLRTVVG